MSYVFRYLAQHFRHIAWSKQRKSRQNRTTEIHIGNSTMFEYTCIVDIKHVWLTLYVYHKKIHCCLPGNYHQEIKNGSWIYICIYIMWKRNIICGTLIVGCVVSTKSYIFESENFDVLPKGISVRYLCRMWFLMCVCCYSIFVWLKNEKQRIIICNYFDKYCCCCLELKCKRINSF